MKLVFTFSDHPNLAELSKDDLYSTSFEVPNESLYLVGCRERVVAIGELAARFTNGSMHLTCKELDLKDYLIKSAETDVSHQLIRNMHATIIYFERSGLRSTHKRLLKIWSPIDPIVPQPYLFRHGRNRNERKSLARQLLGLQDFWCKSEQDFAYSRTIEQLTQQVLVLLNAEPVSDPSLSWQCRGFHPWWYDNVLVDRFNERAKRQAALLRKQQKYEARVKEREEKLKETGRSIQDVPQTGAGRRPGARPGIFKGVQMRSQLEIRFAAELEERGIKWVYEGMVLGQGGYLVDFYLPDLGCWVEVKGRFEARDKILLREVSEDLKRERHERIFVYSQSQAWIVNPSGFKEITHPQFWERIYKL